MNVPAEAILHRHQRVDASAKVTFKSLDGQTRLDTLYQQGSAKIRFPKNHDRFLEAVLINTAGGLTGGDQLNWDLTLGKECEVVAITQACEKAYRSNEGTAALATNIQLARDSTLHWLPQETILYEASSLSRKYTVHMEEGASLLATEAVMLGREAMGENIKALHFQDRWRIHQNGKVIFADDVKLTDPAGSIAGLNGNRAFASLLYVSSESNEQLMIHVTKLRALCLEINLDIQAGFSLVEGKITGRIVAANTNRLRKALIPMLKYMRGRELPRVWRT